MQFCKANDHWVDDEEMRLTGRISYCWTCWEKVWSYLRADLPRPQMELIYDRMHYMQGRIIDWSTTA